MLPEPACVSAVTDPADAPTDDFYNRLQRIWEQVLRLEDMGIIRNESDKFRYAYQLAEAEIQDLCTTAASVH